MTQPVAKVACTRCLRTHDRGKIPQAKPLPKKSGRSEVWKYFSDPYQSTSGRCRLHTCNLDAFADHRHSGKVLVQCLVPGEQPDLWCGEELVYGTSTTCLSNHLNLKQQSSLPRSTQTGFTTVVRLYCLLRRPKGPASRDSGRLEG